jgi:hypothetical protein
MTVGFVMRWQRSNLDFVLEVKVSEPNQYKHEIKSELVRPLLLCRLPD